MSDVCKLTGKPGKFVKCHLSPKSFYNLSSDGDYMVSVATGERHQRSYIGIYDGALVTAETERYFAALDQYAFDFLAPNLDHQTFLSKVDRQNWSGDKLITVEFDKVDVSQLNLFFLSILWRWAASTRPEAADVDLGPYLRDAQEALLTQKFRPDLFGFQILRFVDDAPFFIAPPDRTKIRETNCFRIILGRYHISFRCDRRGRIGKHLRYEALDGQPLVMACTRLADTPLLANMSKALKAHEEKWGNPWPHRDRQSK